jgi:murein L,D-transpeptidase YafK
MKPVFSIALLLMLQQASFKETQLTEARVKIAYEHMEDSVKKRFSDKKLSMDKFQLFLRAFKKEEKLEVWVKEKSKENFALLYTIDFCASSGILGPKRKEGDLQIPEGIYEINHFNPVSNFYLSLGINYPNKSDKILSDQKKPGSAIYIHGNCVTIGCIPITDDGIKELYILAVEARNNGQLKIPVHIFPARLDAGVAEKLIAEYKTDIKTSAFWKNLEPVYSDFQSTNKLRNVNVDAKGAYYF